MFFYSSQNGTLWDIMHLRALVITALLLAPSAAFAQTRATPGTINIPGLDPMVTTTAGDPAAITTTTAAPVTVPTPTPTPAPTTTVPKPSLEQVQQAAETAADLTSGPLSTILAALAGAVGGVLTLLGIQQALKQKDGKSQCPHCQGSGETPAVCSRCNGTKEVEQEYEPKMDCSHCEGSGEDPEERRDEHGKPLDCEECKGEGEVSAKLNVSVPCPDCN